MNGGYHATVSESTEDNKQDKYQVSNSRHVVFKVKEKKNLPIWSNYEYNYKLLVLPSLPIRYLSTFLFSLKERL